MKRYFWVFTLLAAVVFPAATRAQLVWDVTHEPMVGDTQFNVAALSCSGNNCTAVGYWTLQVPLTVSPTHFIFYRSNDGGNTWAEQDPGLPVQLGIDAGLEVTVLDQIDSLNVVGIGDSGLIIRTTDAGASWHVQPSPVVWNTIEDVNFCDPMNGIIAAAGGGVLTTSDGGEHWNQAPHFGSTFMSACHADAPHQFRTMEYDYGTVWSTTDDWAHVDSTAGKFHSQLGNEKNWVLTSWIVRSGSQSGILEAYGTSWWPRIDSIGGRLDTFSIEAALIARSTDNGENWTSVFEDTNGSLVNCMSSFDYDTVIAGPSGGPFNTIYLSTDHGLTWNPETLSFTDTSNNYPSLIARGICRVPSGDFVGAFAASPNEGATFLMRSHIQSAGVSNSEVIAGSFACYPNPASSSIAIASPDFGKQIEVIDILGREVLRGTVPTSGPLMLDVSSLPSGLYYISDGQTRAKFVKD